MKMNYQGVLIAWWVAFFTSIEAKISRPRGVSSAEASFYQPGEYFTCFNTPEKKQIPYSYVNDNYCDCEDGSDEPGTSACQNRSFYCENKGYKPTFIPSSRVDDGICDCCDGSDEDGEKIQCQNQCTELGKKEQEERLRQQRLQEQGYKVKEQYMEQGRKAKEEKKLRLEELQKQKEELTVVKDDLEAKKNEAEAPEKEAKEKHEKAWEEKKQQIQEEKEKEAARKAFTELDTNSDQQLHGHELMLNPSFDKDKDGHVSEEEVKEYLEDLEKVHIDEFTEKIWPNIKEIYKSPLNQEGETKEEETSPSVEVPGAETPDENPPEETTPEIREPWENVKEGRAHEDEDDEGDDDDGDDDDDDEDYFDFHKKEEKKEDEEKMPDYDEETKQLIEAADVARKAFSDADEKVRSVDAEVNELTKYLELDLGPNEEYAPLKDQCFEFTDREYTYKLCPFDKASQRPKSGGTETSLGHWGHWAGPAENKYAVQKYEKGQNCWNGPDRSVTIILHCGMENHLTSASEPSRCEYQFDFTTPAICLEPQPEDRPHDEL